MFAAVEEAGSPVLDAAERHGLRVVGTASVRAACVMAAVMGSLLDAPGCAAVSVERDEGSVRGVLTQAMRDRSPLVVVSDRSLSDELGRIVKASLRVEAATAAHWSAHATQLAMTEPRGPVQLVVTPKVAQAAAVPLATSVRPASPGVPAAATLDLAARFLGDAIRPVLIAGLGCRSVEVAAWIRALAESLPAPVLVTRKGKGALPDPHPLHLGLLEPKAAVHPVLARADLLVTIGVDPTEVSSDAWPTALPVLHLATVPWASPIGRAQLEVVGDISLAIAELAPRLRGRQRADWDVAEIDRLKRAPAISPSRVSGAHRLPRPRVVDVVREAMPPGTVAVIAAGDDDAARIAAWHTVAPGELVAPAPPGVPGFALPAALAARLARPESRVVCFASMRQVLDDSREFATAVRLALPVLVLAVGGAGDPSSGPEIAVSGAVAAGWSATMVTSVDDLRRAIEDALVSTRPVLIDARGTEA